MSTGFSFFGEVTDVLDVLTRQPGLRYSKDDGQNIDPSQSELPQWNTHIRVDIRGGGNSKRESPDFESPVVAISANDG